MTLGELEKLCQPQRFGLESNAEHGMKTLVQKLIAVARAAQSLLSEEGALEAVSHWNAAFALKEALSALEAP